MHQRYYRNKWIDPQLGTQYIIYTKPHIILTTNDNIKPNQAKLGACKLGGRFQILSLVHVVSPR